MECTRELLTYTEHAWAELNETELQTNIRQRKLNELRQKFRGRPCPPATQCRQSNRRNCLETRRDRRLLLKLPARTSSRRLIGRPCTTFVPIVWKNPLNSCTARRHNQSGFDWKGVKLFLRTSSCLIMTGLCCRRCLLIFGQWPIPGVARQMATKQAVNLYQLQKCQRGAQ